MKFVLMCCIMMFFTCTVTSLVVLFSTTSLLADIFISFIMGLYYGSILVYGNV